jgi:hypothetical protein
MNKAVNLLFEVPKGVFLKIQALWDITLCLWASTSYCFEGSQNITLLGLHDHEVYGIKIL